MTSLQSLQLHIGEEVLRYGYITVIDVSKEVKANNVNRNWGGQNHVELIIPASTTFNEQRRFTPGSLSGIIRK